MSIPMTVEDPVSVIVTDYLLLVLTHNKVSDLLQYEEPTRET